MAEGLVTLRSAFDPAETKVRLLAVLKEKGVAVIADIDHAKAATNAGMTLRPTELLIFGKAEGGTPLMQAAQIAGLDLPLKALIWQDADGATWLSYNDPHWIAARHGAGGCKAADGLAATIAALAKHATGT
jgi:uncharacterized protein (DUF302 family)